MTREHDWMRTYTGRRFYPLEPRARDVALEDIAHALSLLCRYTGHVRKFYSVAEHSVYVTSVVATRLLASGKSGPANANVIRWALLHDAAEAYVGDMGRPLKHQPEMSLYRETEARVMGAIAERFGLIGTEPALVRDVDKEIIGTEARILKWGEGLATVDPLPEMIPELRGVDFGMRPEAAESAFLTLWETLERGESAYTVPKGRA